MAIMRRFLRCLPAWMVLASAVAFGGCSIHPIPDDLSYYRTEDIVRNVRCEAKEAVRGRIQLALLERGLDHIDPEKVLSDARNFEIIKRTDPELAQRFLAYGASTIAYKFTFDILEINDNSGSVTFELPFTTGDFTLGLSGGLNKQRKGKRTFRTVEKFKDLIFLNCSNWEQPNGNMVYPLTGSIGVDRIINTFIDVAQLGGAKEQFTDTITFTTYLRGKINPTLVLAPVVDQFRVTKAALSLESSRNDMHTVLVSLAFPDFKKVGAMSALQPDRIDAIAQELKNKAVINLCIADGEAREEQFGMLRDWSPRQYCRLNDDLPPY
jgi:hypothetical protein